MKRFLAVLAASLLTSGLTAAPARAAVSTSPLSPDVSTAQQVAAFWLGNGGANLANATPYNVQATVPGKRVSQRGGVSPGTKPGLVPPLLPSTSDPSKAKTPASTGKVFFVGADGQPHWCTGTSVQSVHRNVVATAAHCVYDVESNMDPLRQWVFVPDHVAGTTPSGLYVGKQVDVHYDFFLYNDFDRDYAFVNVYNGVVPTPEGGLTDLGTLGDKVGGQGLAYNEKLGIPVDVFGYPAGPHPDGTRPYTGETIESSSGHTSGMMVVPILKGEELIAVDSGFTGEGSLGSSWLTSYDYGKRVGYLNGITISVTDLDGDLRYDTSLSAYFDSEAAEVYGVADTLPTGSIA
ncbi:hypothetical protein [Nonomuraea sediminis]|uniref:hypothetical protein n=1 Tax=Nonomuraea sediminis TaxID=2835864 RepID=UPI001BDC6B18|nr:hypothetical protein [Nonomuraea sediminis]